MKVEKYVKRILILLTMFVSMSTVYSQGITMLATKDYPNKDLLWQNFREKYPYQFQMVGLAEFDDNSKFLIISEPPSHVTEAEIRKIFDEYSFDLSVKTHSIGYDGWVKDIVILINNPDRTKFENTLNQLQKYLYHTDYKAYIISLPMQSKSENFLPYNTNLQISVAELQKWFMTDNEILISPNKIETNLNKCLNNSNSAGIYFSKKTGFVIWIVDILEDLKDSKIDARKFALDADLILGAVARGKYVAIIGREREIPVNLLPPLRVETIMRLAATEHSELSQSYERTTLFAGQLYDENDERKDWAPILLSEELWHTEYGQLLNITDQILKSWSENGHIEYEKFNYEKPFEWAFDSSAIKDLQVTQLTYNWNTSGVGYNVLLENNDEIYAINRTGSLPVSYIPDGQEDNVTKDNKVYQAEEIAYNWFSDLNNPDLVQVVQYAAFYQIFQNFHIRYSGNWERLKYNLFNDMDLSFDDLEEFKKTDFEGILKNNPNAKSWLMNYNFESPKPLLSEPNIQKYFEETEKARQKNNINSESLGQNAYSLLLDIANYDNAQKDSIWNYYYKNEMFHLYLYLSLVDSTYNEIKVLTELEYYQCAVPILKTISIDKLKETEAINPIKALDKKEYKAINKSLKKYFKENKIKKLSEKDELINAAITIFYADNYYNELINSYKLKAEYEIDSLSIFSKLDSLQRIFNSYQHTKLSTDENLLEIIAKFSVNREAIDLSKYNKDELYKILVGTINRKDRYIIQAYNEILNLYPLLTIRNNYVNANNNKFTTWIKCPTIVQSFDTRENYVEGGHNLSARTTPYRIDKTVKAGTYKVEKLGDGTKRVLIGTAEDIKNITPKLLREVERTNINGTNNFATTSTKILPRNEIIPAEIPKNPEVRGFISENHIVSDVYAGNIRLTTRAGETKTFANYEELQQFLVKENKSATIIIENVSANEAKANITSAGVTQKAYYKRAEIADNVVDCSRANYKMISENQIEVTFPLENKVNSNIKAVIKDTPIDKIKDYLKLGGKKTNKELMKDLNIKRNDIETILEFENGRISENSIKDEQFNGPIMFSTNAA